MNIFVSVVLAAGVAMLPLCGIAATASTEVRTDRGLVRGQVSDDVLSYKGIPFAAPPTGVNRWREPHPVRSWKGVLEASVFGAALHVVVSAGRQPLTELPALLAAHDVRVGRIEPIRPSLEDAFVSLTGSRALGSEPSQ